VIAISSGVPRHEVSTGLAASGPRSMTRSAHLITSGLCSMTTDAVTGLDQVLEGRKQNRDVAGVKAHGGLVEDEQRIADLFQPRWRASLIRWPSTGERVDGLTEPQVAQPHVDERLKGFLHFFCPVKEDHRLPRLISRISRRLFPRDGSRGPLL